MSKLHPPARDLRARPLAVGGSAAALLATLLVAGCVTDLAFPGAIPLRSVRAASGPFRAGAAKVDITPDVGCDLGGFSVFRDATGVHDPLYVRALVLERGDVRVALLAFDVLGIQAGEIDAVRPSVPGLAPEDILLHATHNHAGPDTVGFWGTPPFWSGVDPDYMDRLREAAARALALASASLRPAEVGAAGAPLDPRGLVKNLRRPGLVDREVTVLHLREAGGGPTIATVLVFGAHPELAGPDNTLLSADFPGPLVARLEEALGGTGIFLAGALGAMVTPDGKSDEASRWGEVERVGRAVADHGLAIVAALPGYDGAPALEHLATHVYLPVGNWRYQLGRRLGLFRRDTYEGRLRTEVHLLQIGQASLVTVPGEIAPDAGMRLKALLKGPVRALVGLVDDELGYLLDPADFDLPLFRYEVTFSPGPLSVPLIEDAVDMLLRAQEVRAP